MYRPFKKLRLRMVELDYNQKDLARAAGIVPSTFSLRIRGKQPFNSAQIAAIARGVEIVDGKWSRRHCALVDFVAVLPD